MSRELRISVCRIFFYLLAVGAAHELGGGMAGIMVGAVLAHVWLTVKL